MTRLIASADLPAEIVERISRTAEGNPLFLEEILGMLIDDGLLTRGRGPIGRGGDVNEIVVPPSIQALLAARVDRLTPDERACSRRRPSSGRSSSSAPSWISCPEMTTSTCGQISWPWCGKSSSVPSARRWRRGCVPVPPSADPRLGIRGDPQSTTRGAPRTSRRLAGARRRRRGRGARGDRRLSPGTGVDVSNTARPRRRALGRDRPTGGRPPRDGRTSSIRRGDFPASANLLRRASSIDPPDDAERAATLYHLGVALDEVGGTHATWRRSIGPCGWHPPRAMSRWNGSPASAAPRSRPPPTLTACSTEECRVELEEAIARFGGTGGRSRVWLPLGRSSPSSEFMPCRYDRASRARAEPSSTRVGAATKGSSPTPSFAPVLAVTSAPPSRKRAIRTLDEMS